MVSHFNSIGFSVRTESEFVAVLERACREGRSAAEEPAGADGPGRYAVWSPNGGGGAQMWVQQDAAGRVIGCNPHYAGRGRVRLGVTAVRPDPDHPLDGALYGWVNPDSDSLPDSGDYPVLIDLPDYRNVAAALGNPPRTLTLQVAAFAHELTLFESEEEYEGHRSLSESLKFAATAFLPSGLFCPEPAPPLAHAIFAGRIEAWERHHNAATGEPFYALLVRTLGGTYDVVADPSQVEVTPRVGGIARGSFWLSGRVVAGLPPEVAAVARSGVHGGAAPDWLRYGNFARGRAGVLVA
jgi:hypothetical protein